MERAREFGDRLRTGIDEIITISHDIERTLATLR